jgi:ribose transport system substrate-binding protein
VRGRLAAGLLALAAALSACGERREGTVFALVPKAMNNPFFDQARDGCKAAERELDGVSCLYIGPGEHTEAEQVQIVQDLITRGVDGIAVSPSNAPAMARALERARAAGIPAITWDSDLLEEDRALRATYLGTRNYDIGVRQAEVLRGWKPEGGTLCIQSGGPAASNHNERMQGLRDALSGARSAAPPGERLAGAGGWREADGCPLFSNDDLPLAVSQMEDVLARDPDLDAFVVTGGFPQFVDAAYRRVAEKHRERLRSGRTIVIAADTLAMQMALLREGLSHAQIGQRPFEMGYRAMFVLRDLRAGRDVADPIHTGIDVCVPENAAVCLRGTMRRGEGT